ncbi:TetR/AcrR family transcriptional regulator [Paraburkholderia oxyphila]|uniref:TetR/AcrR family transcriptional regulator n=1 Tax=Paraburkholderia oxyphila TaxID=614212 RepID=UPI0004823C98|nr:TetR/AcrR family transcriptional regulator [Paraburkholderia oxyphila]
MARPREFNEEQVLEAAGDAFWARGYEGTTTRDLVRVTGLTQPSLYNAFGDKRGLFLRAFKHYVDHNLWQRIERLESTLTPAAAITAFFGDIIERSLSDPLRRGCMLVNSALEATSDDEELRKAVASELTQLREFFLRCMKAGCESGEIPVTVSAEDAATQLLAILLGMRVLARVNPKRPLLKGSVAPALALLGLPSLRGRT